MTDRSDALVHSIRIRLAGARRLVADIADAPEYAGGPHYDDYIEERTETLNNHVLFIERSMRLLMELLSVPAFMGEFNASMAAVDRSKVVKYYDEHDFPYSPVVDELAMWLELLCPPAPNDNLGGDEKAVLRRILAHIPQLMELSNEVPAREADVQILSHKYIQLAYPDALREVAVPQPGRTYKPDVGIDSLSVAIELKFADNATEAKRAVDELYVDMKGYSTSKDYRSFFGVIYMTGPHASEQVLNAQMRRVGTPKSWDTFLVIGRGARPRKGSKTDKSV